MTNLFNQLKDHSQKRAKNDRLTSSEYERYLTSNFISLLRPDEFVGFDVLGYWKAKESMFPILSRMTWDILSVQATSVASKFAFSTSGHVLSIRRTRLTPASLEIKEVLEYEPIAFSDEEIALDEAASEARSNGPEGEDVDLTLAD
ncbi:zinc finger BED domain-containing protein RICESLEEPER 2-like protein [Tanacetum coccineum]